jgi:hypothetical protein
VLLEKPPHLIIDELWIFQRRHVPRVGDFAKLRAWNCLGDLSHLRGGGELVVLANDNQDRDVDFAEIK